MREAEQETSPVKHAQRVGAQLLLKDFNVMQCAAAWVQDYSGGVGLQEPDHFVSLVRNLLRRPVHLQVVYFHGVTRNTKALLSQHGLWLLCGDERHALSQELLASGGMFAALSSLAWLEHPERGCFLSQSTEGLDGELHLSGFIYDNELQALYEPSYQVMALYLVHLTSLYHTTGQQCDEDWVPRHLHSLGPLSSESLDAEGSLDSCGEDTVKRARCRRDLQRLREVLETSQFGEAIQSLTALWEEKTAWCEARIDELL